MVSGKKKLPPPCSSQPTSSHIQQTNCFCAFLLRCCFGDVPNRSSNAQSTLCSKFHPNYNAGSCSACVTTPLHLHAHGSTEKHSQTSQLAEDNSFSTSFHCIVLWSRSTKSFRILRPKPLNINQKTDHSAQLVHSVLWMTIKGCCNTSSPVVRKLICSVES